MVFGFLINGSATWQVPRHPGMQGHMTFLSIPDKPTFACFFTSTCGPLPPTLSRTEDKMLRCCNTLLMKMHKSSLLWLVHMVWKIQIIPAAAFKPHEWKTCGKSHSDSAMPGQQRSIFQMGVTAQAVRCHDWRPPLDSVWHWSDCTASVSQPPEGLWKVWATARNK